MPQLPTILVDNNALSRPELADRVRGKTIYLADAVMYELFGAGQWERSISGLGRLAPFAEHVVGTTNLGTLLRTELATGMPTTLIIGDPVVNGRLAALLRGCQNEPSRAVDYFRKGQPTVPPERAVRIGGISEYRSLSLDVIDFINAQLDPSELALLVNQPERVAGLFAEIDIWPSAIDGFRQLPIASNLDCPNWDPVKMASMPCCWMRLFLSELCYGVRRAVKESFPNISDDDLHGDQNDREIVILATYADEFFSADRGAVWLERALRSCVDNLFQHAVKD